MVCSIPRVVMRQIATVHAVVGGYGYVSTPTERGGTSITGGGTLGGHLEDHPADDGDSLTGFTNHFLSCIHCV